MSNNARCTNMKSRWLSIFMLSFLPLLSGCANGSQPPKPPINLPFEVQKAGNRVETEMRIVEEKEYRFALVFMYNKDDRVARDRVRKLAGGAEVNKNGKLTEPGIPILLRFKIGVIDTTGERPMLEKEISELRVSSYGSGHVNKQIIYLTLKPGHYRVSIESIKDVPELIGTPVVFQIGFYSKL